MHLVHVYQLVIDFYFKDIVSTNKNLKTYIFIFLLLSSLSYFYQVQSCQFSPKHCKMKADYDRWCNIKNLRARFERATSVT